MSWDEAVDGVDRDTPGGRPPRAWEVAQRLGLRAANDDVAAADDGLPAYAELHCLSDFSFLRGAASAEELFERARDLGYEALAITDECTMAGIVRARAVVVTIPDPGSSRKVVRICRSRNADSRIIVRTRYIREVEELRLAGADEVIPEEFETSIEIVARVLRSLHIPGNLIATQVRILRDEAYRKLRDPLARPETGRRLSALMAAGTSDLVLILPEMAAVGKTLGELHLEEDHVAVPALLRDGVPLAPPPLDVPIEAGDTLLVVGAHEDLVHATKRLEG